MKATHRNKPALAGDIFAGLTLWAVFSAQAIAYSRLAHATPVAGLVTAIAGALVYAALGTSLRISIGPAGGICAIVGATVAGVPPERLVDSIAALTIMSGLFLVVFGLARLTFLQRLFPTPVFVGYLAGTGFSILIGQAQDLVGHGTYALMTGLAAIAGVLALKWLAPRVPAPFVVLTLATIASTVWGFSDAGIPVIGSALGHFGDFAHPFAIGIETYKAMLLPAIGLALFVYVDSLANSHALAEDTDPPIRARREYFAMGAVNLASGLGGGFVAGCSTSRSVVAMRAGANSRLAPAIAGVLLFLSALSVVRLIEPMPLAALAGVVFVAAFDLIDVKRLREFFALRAVDFWIAIAAGAGVVLVGPMWGVGVGVGLALAEAFHRAAQPHRSVLSGRSPDHYFEPFESSAAPLVDGTLIYRFGTPLFFGNADVFGDDMEALASTAGPALRTVIVDADTLGLPDATGREGLRRAQRALAQRNIRLVFGNARAREREALRAAGFTLIDETEFIDRIRKIRAAAGTAAAKSA